MRFLAFVAVASIAVQFSAVLATQCTNVQMAFSDLNYTPDILAEVPENILKVQYPSIEVCLGNKISQTRVSVQPKIYYDFKPGVNYTVIMIDPDVPSAQAPLLSSYLHWFEVNINGGTGCESGEVIAKYITPAPYPGSGPHRYTVLLYEQTQAIDVAALLSRRYGVKRYKFSAVAVAEEYGLKLVAANFFITSVPAITDEYYCTGPTCTNVASSLSNIKSLDNDLDADDTSTFFK